MAIQFNDNLKIQAPKPTDYRYGPWSTIEEALQNVIYRHLGLTVKIGSVEYWFKDGILDNDLIVKTSNATHTGEVTGDSALTITNKAVTFSKMQDISPLTFIGRDAGNGSPESLDVTRVKEILGITAIPTGTLLTTEVGGGTNDINYATIIDSYPVSLADPGPIETQFRGGVTGPVLFSLDVVEYQTPATPSPSTPLIVTQIAYVDKGTAKGIYKRLASWNGTTMTNDNFTLVGADSSKFVKRLNENLPLLASVKYGNLYNWFAVNDSRNIAPTGWHVATDAEWTTLENYVTTNLGTSVSVAKALAATTDWATYSAAGAIGNNPSINNYSGFSGLPGGFRSNYDGTFYDVSNTGYWWSSSEISTTYAYYRYLYYYGSTVGSSYDAKSTGCSVRCIKDDNIPTPGGITYDLDGNKYTEVLIGTQIWMVENLKTTKYRNGGDIPKVISNTAWTELTTGAYCIYGNPPSPEYKLVVEESISGDIKKITKDDLKTNLSLTGTNSGNETVTTIGALIGTAGDATPNDTDYVATSLTSGGILKKITWTDVKAFLKMHFDTFYLLKTKRWELGASTAIPTITTTPFTPEFTNAIYKADLNIAGNSAISWIVGTTPNLPISDSCTTVYLKNVDTATRTIALHTADCVHNGITYSFNDITGGTISVANGKVLEISYLFVFSSATACRVNIITKIQA